MSKNPKVVIDAMLPAIRSVGEIVLRPITLGVLLMLEKIGSPLVADKNLTPGRKPAKPNLSNPDIVRVVFILTHPVAESLVLFNRGADVFDAAVYNYAESIKVSDLPALGSAINEHFVAAFSTIVSDAGKSGSKKNETPGQNSKTSEATTASAGRSS